MKKPTDNPYVDSPDVDFEPIDDVNISQAKKHVAALREAISYHDHRYYVEHDPIIADSVYDALFQRLSELEERFDLVTDTSPTQRVGGTPQEGFETVMHAATMGSLDSSADKEKVKEFDARVRKDVDDVSYFAEPKYDGISIELVYENGRFVRAVTRGDGEKGDDVSENVKTIRSVPLQLKNAPAFLSVRGEILLRLHDFLELNKHQLAQGKNPFANPRNAAAGTIRQLDPRVVAERKLAVFCYDILECSDSFETQEEVSRVLQRLGLPISGRHRVVSAIDEFIQFHGEVEDARDELPYEIDGVVVKVNSISKQHQLGMTSRHPKWAFAYKFLPRSEQTTVRDVVVQVGRTGKLTPVVLMAPVDVSGVTISRASLHNEDIAKELGVKAGSVVKVRRAGDVIPEVYEVVKKKEKGAFAMPFLCPVCGSDVEREGKYHFCTGGVACPAQLKGGLQHYASRDALDITGLGERVADELVDRTLVTKLSDLYQLTVEDLSQLPDWGETSAQNLIDEIEVSKRCSLARFLYGLGIRHVGKETARLLAERFSLSELQNVSIDDLLSVDGIGPTIAESIHSFFSGNGVETVQALLAQGVQPKREERGDALSGLTFVFTGSLEGFTRSEAKDLVVKHGGHVSSRVSSNTHFVVCGANPGSKKAKAEELDIPILTEQAFTEKMDELLSNF